MSTPYVTTVLAFLTRYTDIDVLIKLQSMLPVLGVSPLDVLRCGIRDSSVRAYLHDTLRFTLADGDKLMCGDAGVQAYLDGPDADEKYCAYIAKYVKANTADNIRATHGMEEGRGELTREEMVHLLTRRPLQPGLKMLLCRALDIRCCVDPSNGQVFSWSPHEDVRKALGGHVTTIYSRPHVLRQMVIKSSEPIVSQVVIRHLTSDKFFTMHPWETTDENASFWDNEEHAMSLLMRRLCYGETAWRVPSSSGKS